MLPIIYSDEFLEHHTGRFHPESPARLQAIVEALKTGPWAQALAWHLPTPISQRQDLISVMEQVHRPNYLRAVENLAARGGGRIDADTPVSPQSYQVALLAVSACLDGVDQVLAIENPAFVLARPPGHHALAQEGMGFCIFSNAAIAAHYALSQSGIKRVAILDWDVHHGNGTQAIVESHPQIAYCSIHQAPCYPGTGTAQEQGDHQNVLNLPVPGGSSGKDYEHLFQAQVIPFLTRFQPDLLIVSAGYDANQADPLAEMALQPEDYGVFTRYCLGLTRRILFGLEGGYDLPSLAASVQATLASCLVKA